MSSPTFQRIPRRPNAPEMCWRYWLAVGLVLGAQAGLLAYSATRHGPTVNEPAHLVAGLSHWRFGRFDLYPVNPPLTHYMAALPVLAAAAEEDWSEFVDDGPGARPESRIGQDFIAANGERSFWLFTIARWGCIPISLFGGLCCFLWSRELWSSNLSGLLSLTLWCFDPNILAHGELITPDCAGASFGLWAAYFYWRWLLHPSWARVFPAGLGLGLALLSKLTWIVLLLLWPAIWLLGSLTALGRDSERRAGIPHRSSSFDRQAVLQSLLQLVGIIVLGIYLLNSGYGFDGIFPKIGNFEFVSHTLNGAGKPGIPGNRFTATAIGNLRLPLPQQYVRGIDLQKRDFESYRKPSYLQGEWRNGGWWYYYLYGLAVKVPHGTQFLMLVAVWVFLSREWKGSRVTGQVGESPRAKRLGLTVVAVPAVAVFILVSSQLEFSHHFRYVLPVFGFAFVFIGCLAGQYVLKGSTESALCRQQESIDFRSVSS